MKTLAVVSLLTLLLTATASAHGAGGGAGGAMAGAGTNYGMSTRGEESWGVPADRPHLVRHHHKHVPRQ